MSYEELELLRKYLHGNATPAEEQCVRRWLTRNEGDEDLKQLLWEEWKQTSTDNESDLDMEEAWGEFKQKVNNSSGQREWLNEASDPERSSGQRLFPRVAIFVIVILLSSISLFLVFHFSDRSTVVKEEITYSVKKTNRGEKLNISLPDGSFIKLNSSTELRIPDNYNTGKERIVYLEGEAFFEVAKDKNKLFKVISSGVTTQVLGTSFNVNTSGHDNVSVAVVTGKVRVANNNLEIILRPEEMTTVGPATRTPAKMIFNIDSITGWRNDLLIFDKVLFEEIIERLEQWYGVDFLIEGKPHHKGKYSGRFENKSLESVLKGLGFSSAFEYKIIDKTVYLKFK